MCAFSYAFINCLYNLDIFHISRLQGAVVFIGSHSHTVSAISMETGKALWQTLLGGRVESSACLSHCGKLVVVGKTKY